MPAIMHGRFRPGIVTALLLLGCAYCIPADAAVSAPVLKWDRGGCEYGCETGWYSSPSVADIDGDKHKEIIWGAYDVVSLDGATGAVEWRAPHSQRVYAPTVVADLTGDGTLEVVVGRNSDNLMVYDNSGTLLWTRHPFGTGEVRTLAVADLEGDGVLEIIVGGFTNPEQVYVYDPNGNVRPGWPAKRSGEPGYGAGLFNQNIAVEDMDHDGDLEVFATTDSHYIQAFDDDGNQLPVNAMYTNRYYWSQVGIHVDHAVDLRGYANCGVEHRPNFADAAPAIADIDGNGTPEFIVVGNVYNCATNPYTSLYHIPLIFNLDRTRWNGSGFDWTVLPTPPPNAGPKEEDWQVILTAVNSVAVADLDGDGFKEILFPSYDGRLHAYWLDKTQHGSWPYTVPSTGSGVDTFRFASEPAIADLDGDGKAEVLFTSWPKYAVNQSGHFHILDSLGNELYRIPLPGPSGSWSGGLAAPTLADIDDDGEMEVVIGTAEYGVVTYDLPGVSANARVLWRTGRGNFLRTGTPPSRRQVSPNSDFDSDGVPDIFWRDPATGQNAIWYMKSNGTSLKSGAWAPMAATNFFVGGIAAFDTDGVPDVFWRDPATGQNALYYVQNKGRSLKSAAWAPTVATNWVIGGADDFDADGVPDILWRDPATGQNAIWYMKNDGKSFKSAAWAPMAATNWAVGGIADFDADGVPDILWHDPATGQNALYYIQNKGRSLKSAAWAPTVTTNWIVGKIADFDADGVPDIFWRDPATGQNAIWYMKNNGRSLKSAVWAPTLATNWDLGG